MAVVVQCFQCSAVIELDEGFRGGVCRCSGCGTLLQVPRGEVDQARRKSRPATPVLKANSSLSAAAPGMPPPPPDGPQKPDRQAPADAPADSGGSSSLLQPVHPTRPIAQAAETPDAGQPAPAFNAQAPASGALAPSSGKGPAIGQPTQNERLLWTALGLMALLAIALMIYLMIAWPRHEEAAPPGTLPSAATTRSGEH